MQFDAIVQLGSFGVLAWLVWFMFSQALPKLIAEFLKMLQRLEELFVNEMRMARERFSADLRDMQQTNISSYREHRTAMVGAIEELTTATQELRVEMAKKQGGST